MIAAGAFVYERRDAVFAVPLAPFHQARTTASGNVDDVIEGIAAPVETNGLVPSPGGTVFAVQIGTEEFALLGSAQSELSFGHMC